MEMEELPTPQWELNNSVNIPSCPFFLDPFYGFHSQKWISSSGLP